MLSNIVDAGSPLIRPARLPQTILLISLAALSWLGMMLVHESGHMLAAFATGGRVRELIFYPLAFSRTVVDPNPRPLLEVWAGPAFGAALPLACYAIASLLRAPGRYLLAFFAGFCLLANGAYLGLDVIDGVGDAGDLLRLGAPPWSLIAFGIIACAAGLVIWHHASPQFGFGRRPKPISPRLAYVTLAAAAAALTLSFILGHRGP